MPARLMVEPVAVAKWKELVPILLTLGSLTESDGEALATLCEVHAAAQAALLELRAGGRQEPATGGGAGIHGLDAEPGEEVVHGNLREASL